MKTYRERGVRVRPLPERLTDAILYWLRRAYWLLADRPLPRDRRSRY